MARRAASDRYDRICSVVAKVPKGRVATYGQIAALAGLPGAARQVGYALHARAEARALPWQRIINARGEISLPQEFGMGSVQRQLLEQEGIVFDERGRISLRRYQWQPRQRAK
jgi:methylated-DNA-protein-cysteine methyltransferase-like protein